MERKNTLLPANIVASVLIAVLVISTSVTSVLFDRGAYDRMQEKLDLSVTTGIDETILLANYDALIDYNSIFFKGSLEFPTFSMSETGRIHFEEVKAIFSVFQLALIVSAVLSAVFFVALFRRRQYRFLAFGGALSLIIPGCASCAVAIVGWDRFFTLFHQLLFNNEFWVFDASADPIILILPDAFFLNCLIRIIVGITVSAVLLSLSAYGLKHLRKV